LLVAGGWLLVAVWLWLGTEGWVLRTGYWFVYLHIIVVHVTLSFHCN
jgi:hypothetical protein